MAKWIQKANIQKGGLHRSLGIPQGKPIPASRLEPDPHDSTKVAKQKSLARTFKKIR